MHSERCAPTVRHYIFRRNLRIWRNQNMKESKTFTFFIDCSIVDAKLVSVPRYSVVSDALIEIRCALVVRH